MKASDRDPIPAMVPAGAVGGTRIYFDPVRWVDVMPNITAEELAKDGPIGVRLHFRTGDGDAYHYMTLRGARRRMDDFNDAIEAAERGAYADVNLTAADVLRELNPNGRAF